MKIQERWTAWANALGDLGEKEYTDARETFFAGAMAAFTLIRDAAAISRDSVAVMVEELNNELVVFKDELKRKAMGGISGKAKS